MPYADPIEQSEYQCDWVKNRRDAWIQENGPCNCGSRIKLEVHHVDRTKKVTHRVWSWSDSRRLEELAKCIVLCSECHKAETRKQRSRIDFNHGTHSAYASGCRCDACRKAHNRYCKEYQHAKRLTK